MKQSIFFLTITLCGLASWLPITNTILLIISTILLALLVIFMYLLLFGSRFNIYGSCIKKFHSRDRRSKKPDIHDKEKGPDSKGYSLNCNNSSTFPYNNKYQRFF